jgi:virginiamycin B lyase
MNQRKHVSESRRVSKNSRIQEPCRISFLLVIAVLIILITNASFDNKSATSEARTSILAQTRQTQSTYDPSPIKNFDVPTNNSGPLAIISGGNGTMWFSEYYAGKIGEFFISNDSIREFQVPENDSRPAGLSVDSFGNIWFTDESGPGSIWSFNPSTDRFTQYRTHSSNSTPVFVIVDSKNNVWFTESTSNKIGELSYPTYVMSEFELPVPNSGPVEMAFGQNDSMIWITQSFAGKVASFNVTSRAFKEYSPSSNEALRSPVGIVLDINENVWVSDHGGSSVDELIPSNSTFIKFPTSVPSVSGGYSISAVATLAIDKQGKLWFVEHFSNKVGVLDPKTGIIQEFKIPATGAYSVLNALDTNGNFWFTEYYANKIGEISANSTSPISVTMGSYQEAKDAAGHKIVERVIITNRLDNSIVVQLGDSSSFTQTGQTPASEVSINATTINLEALGNATINVTITPEPLLRTGVYSVGVVASYVNESSDGIIFIAVQGQFSITRWLEANFQILIVVAILLLTILFFAMRRTPGITKKLQLGSQ